MLLFVVAPPSYASSTPLLEVPVTIVATDGKSHGFTVELAETPTAWRSGLMFRDNLPKNRGMLFIYPIPQPVTMWMKNTFIPLDMLFIDISGQITHIAANRIPHSESHVISLKPVIAVLEIPGGTVDKLNITIGSQIKTSAVDFVGLKNSAGD